MTRIKRGLAASKKHKKILKQVKGFRGSRKHRIKLAKEALLKSGLYAYRDRRAKKRDFRKLWIIRLNAALKKYNLRYSQFINALKKTKMGYNRKILADLALNHPDEFEKIVEKLKSK